MTLSTMSTVETLTVTIYVGYSATFEVKVNPSSGYLYTMALSLQSLPQMTVITTTPATTAPIIMTPLLVDLEEFLKDINVVAVTTYVCALLGDLMDITISDVAAGCLQIYSKTEDKNFFHHMLSQLFANWTLLSPVLYEDNIGINNYLIEEVWTCCPRQVLPRWFLNNELHMKHWLGENSNRDVLLNNNERCQYKIKEISSTKNFRELYDANGTSTVSICTSDFRRKIDDFRVTVTDSSKTCINADGTERSKCVGHEQYRHFKGCPPITSRHGLFTSSLSDEEDRIITHVIFSGRTYGPTMTKGKDGYPLLTGYSYKNISVGETITYHKGGRLRTISKHDVNGEEVSVDKYRDDEHNTLLSHTDFTEDGDLNHFVQHNLDGGRLEIDDDDLMSVYGPDGKLRCQITNVLDLGDKQMTVYDSDGVIISVPPFGNDVRFEPNMGSWVNNTQESVELQLEL